MPERPPPPDLQNLLTDVLRRLRAVERQTILLPEGTKPLQAFEDAAPLGEARFIDFAEGLQAVAIGDDWIRVRASPGGADAWDAVVDEDFIATDEQAREFRGIGEALQFLFDLGLDHANVFVRNGTYVETSNFTAPARVLLFGGAAQVPADNSWDLGAFSMSGCSYLSMYRMNLELHTAGSPLGSIVQMEATNCHFDCLAAAITLSTAYGWYTNCSFDNIGVLGVDVMMLNCDVLLRSGTKTPATGSLVAYGLRFTSSTETWTIPARTAIHLAPNFSRVSSSVSSVLTLSRSSSSSHITIVNDGEPDVVNVSLTGTGHEFIALRGSFQSITAVGGTAMSIAANIRNAADITGPASVNLIGGINVDIILRGTAISGNVTVRSTAGSGTYLQFINADYCDIVASGNGTGTSGTAKSFSLDASSDKNILHFAGDTTFAVAGTDAGTNNNLVTT